MSRRRTGRPEGILLDGALIRDRRGQLGLSQAEAAASARIGTRTLRGAENGEPVSPDTAKRVASALGLTYIELLRPPAELVADRLSSRGLAPLPLHEVFSPVFAAQALQDALDSGAKRIVVAGPSGVGKSTLVRHVLAQRADTWPDGRIWVAAARLHATGRIADLCGDIAAALGFASRLPDPELVPASSFDNAFRRNLWRWPRLLVLDDVRDPDLPKRFVTDDSDATVIITTHHRWIADALGGTRIEVEAWEPDQIRKLILDTTGNTGAASDPEGMQRLLELVGGLPLHARLAATGVQRIRLQTIGDYADRLSRDLKSATHNQPSREPLVRNLLDSVGDSLPEGALDALRALCVFGSEPFIEPFASAATELEPHQIRAVLDALGDAYLLDVLETGSDERRYALDERAVGAWGGASKTAAIDALLRAGPQLTATLLDEPRADHQAEAWLEDITAWRSMLDAITDHLIGDHGPARTPAEVPRISAEASSRAANLPSILLGMLGILRVAPPAHAGRWLTAALAVAQGQGDDRTWGQLAWLLAWWWFIRGEDNPTADTWARASAHELQETGPPDLAAAVTLHAAFLARARGGMAAAAPIYAEAVALCEQQQVNGDLLAGAYISMAAAHVLGHDEPNWSAALASAERGRDTLQRDSHRNRTIRGVATIQSATIRYLGALELLPTAEVEEAFADILPAFGRNMFFMLSMRGTAEALGAKLDWSPPESEAWLTADPTRADAFVDGIAQMITHFGGPGTDRIDDSVNESRLGQLSSTPIAGFPLDSGSGVVMEALHSLEPIRAVLDSRGLREARQLVRAVRGPDHPLIRAIDAVETIRKKSAST